MGGTLGAALTRSSERTVTHNEHRLLRHLVVTVVLKLVVLALVWWMFVRDNQVPVDAEQSARQLGLDSAVPGAQP